MAFLQWRDGHGAVRVLASIDDCYLIEDAGDTSLRDHLRIHGDEATTEILTSVLRKLHAPASKALPADLPRLEAHFASLFKQASLPQEAEMADLFSFAIPLTHDLLAGQRDVRPLHGDLHHENVVGTLGGAWSAIDPQGVIGDPVYDVANVFGNPRGETALVLDPARAIRLSRHFAEVFDCKPEKVLQFALAHAALSVCWSLADGPSDETATNMRERLAFARQAKTLLTSGALG